MVDGRQAKEKGGNNNLRQDYTDHENFASVLCRALCRALCRGFVITFFWTSQASAASSVRICACLARGD